MIIIKELSAEKVDGKELNFIQNIQKYPILMRDCL